MVIAADNDRAMEGQEVGRNPGERSRLRASGASIGERIYAVASFSTALACWPSGGLTILPPSPEVFGVVDPADAEWLRRRLTPLPLKQLVYLDTLLLKTDLTTAWPLA